MVMLIMVRLRMAGQGMVRLSRYSKIKLSMVRLSMFRLRWLG